jgi:outer membrane lipoprotein SlyB
MTTARHLPSLRLAVAACSLLAATLFAQAAPSAAPVSASAPSARQLAALCDTCAIVTGVKSESRKGKASGIGAAGGAVAGGVVGHQVGNGGVLGTGAGAVAGGLLGHEIEKRMKRHKVWVTTVTMRDGTTHKFDADHEPAWHAGDHVRVENKALVRDDGTHK